MKPQKSQYGYLIKNIGTLLSKSRAEVYTHINLILVQTYWEIGQYIVEFEQDGNESSEYGSQLLTKLSKDLTTHYGKGFSRSNLFYMRKLYLTFRNSETLSHYLSWSHYFEILKADSKLEINYFLSKYGYSSKVVKITH